MGRIKLIQSASAVRIAVAVILSTCLLAAGCFVAPRNAGQVALSNNPVWPPAPQTPRIRFERSVSSPRDLGIYDSLARRVYHYVIGKHPASVISPYGITCDRAGRVYVVDTFSSLVHVFDAKRGMYHAFPEDSPPTGNTFIDIAIDDTMGHIFLSDSAKGVVRIFSDQGQEPVQTIGRDVFYRPTGLTVNNKTAELLVVDTQKSRVFRFDLATYTLKGSFGGKGKEDGRLHFPTNVAVTGTGNIIVSDSLNFRIQVFSPDGRFLTKIGRPGQSPGCFSRPKGVAADSDGHIYVVDALFDNVQIFDADGRLLLAFGTHGRGPGEFWLPTGIYIDSDDRIYVADSFNKRIQIFRYLHEN